MKFWNSKLWGAALLLLLLLFTVGCAVNMFDRIKLVGGDGEIKSGCDAEGVCTDIVKGADASAGFLAFIVTLLDGIPGVELGSPAAVTNTNAPADVLYVHPAPAPAPVPTE